MVETYPATPAEIGNSRGYWIDTALFEAHPELGDGSFEAAYMGEGVLLLRSCTVASNAPLEIEDDPVAAAYLAWIARSMAAHPGLLRPMNAQEFDLAEELVRGIPRDQAVDCLPDDFELP